jgi:hypothetical protein
MKEDGTHEKFHRSYIVESLETIGMDHKTAKTIAERIEPHKGISEHEIKVSVFKILDEMDSKLADEYLVTKKVYVKSESFQVDGAVLVPKLLMEYLDLHSNDKVDVIHCHKRVTLRAHERSESEKQLNVIYMSEHDMKKLDSKNRSLVAICKHVE